jgi:hypothetical protein
MPELEPLGAFLHSSATRAFACAAHRILLHVARRGGHACADALPRGWDGSSADALVSGGHGAAMAKSTHALSTTPAMAHVGAILILRPLSAWNTRTA